MFKFKTLILSLFMLLINQTQAQTLNVGDIAIIGVHTDTPDQFVWIALTDIPAGEIIYFSDKGWDANLNTWFANSEAHIAWTSPAGGISCGTIIHIEYGGGAFVTTGGGSTAIADGSWSLLGGDQLMAYRGGSGFEPSAPVFLHAVNCDYDPTDYNATTTWSNGNTNTSSFPSMLPLGLTNGVDCISIYPAPGPEFDNNRYTGTLTGTSASVFASINNAANWTAQNDVTILMDAGQFSTPSVICSAPCTDPDVPTLTATPATICPGTGTSTLSWTGNLNDATQWEVYTSGCGLNNIGNSTSNSFVVSPSLTTTYFIRGEGGCVVPGVCNSITITVEDVTPPTAICQNINVFLDGTGTASISAADLDGGSTDNCSGVNLSASQTTFTCADLMNPLGELIITAIYDGPLSGGTPKGIELYVANDIADLSEYGLGSANNGGGTDGEEFTFPAVSATAGEYIYVATESVEFMNWFGFMPDYVSFSVLVNGDDAVELFHLGSVIDVFGDINLSGTGQPWEYTDGFATRNNGTGPDGSSFQQGDWTYSGINVWDGETSNATAVTPITFGNFSPAFTSVVGVDLTVNDGNGNTDVCTAQVTVLDTIVPGPDVASLVDINQACEVASLTAPTATDNCSMVTVTNDATLPISSSTTITWTYTDGSGNSSTQVQNVIINDATPPTASNPAAIAVGCIGDVPTPDPLVVTDEADNCALPTVSFVSDVSDGLTCPETITRTYSVTDGGGNSINVTQTITVHDVTPPTASNPILINVECIGDVPAPDVLVVTDEADNCSIPVVAFVSDVSDGLTCPETITRTYSVTDDCGNSINVTQSIIVNDVTGPVADVAALATITSDCPVTPSVPTATDNCSGALTATPDVAFPITASTTINWSFTDVCGNVTTQTQDVTISPIDVSTTTNLVMDDQYIISANSTGNTYQWIEDCGNTNAPISGQTNIDFAPPSNGSYAVIVDNGSCSDTSDCVIIDDLSVIENGFSSNISVYPNPTIGSLSIGLNDHYSEVSVRVINAIGQEVFMNTYLATNKIELKLDSAPGMYILEIITNDGKIARVNVLIE